MEMPSADNGINVAVVLEGGLVKVYGPSENSFRKLKFTHQEKSRAAAILWAWSYNDKQKKRLAITVH